MHIWDCKGETPFFSIVHQLNDHVEDDKKLRIIQLFIDYGVDVNIKSGESEATLLILAVCYRQVNNLIKFFFFLSHIQEKYLRIIIATATTIITIIIISII